MVPRGPGKGIGLTRIRDPYGRDVTFPKMYRTKYLCGEVFSDRNFVKETYFPQLFGTSISWYHIHHLPSMMMKDWLESTAVGRVQMIVYSTYMNVFAGLMGSPNGT